MLVCVVARWVEAGRGAWCGPALFLPRVCPHPFAVERDRAGKGEEIASVGGDEESQLQTHLCALLAAPRNFRGESVKRRGLGEAYVNEPLLK